MTAPRPLRGRVPRTLRLQEAIPLTKAELDTLRAPRYRTVAERFREPHHLMARLLAQGLSQGEVARAVGYSVTRIAQLESDPAFRQLMAVYRQRLTEKIEATFDHALDLMAHNMIRAERTIADHFDKAEDAGELIPLKTALAIRADAADRLGYGKKQTNVNVNVDFAAQLEKARQRVRTIEGELAAAPSASPSGPENDHASRSSPALQFRALR